MEPATPVSELTRANITLVCQVEAGNPSQLQAVKWYLDGELLKELPDCDNNTANCDIDPSKLLLQIVERTFHGNYSCIGMNEAGWGPLSPNTELIVYCKSNAFFQSVSKTERLKPHNFSFSLSASSSSSFCLFYFALSFFLSCSPAFLFISIFFCSFRFFSPFFLLTLSSLSSSSSPLLPFSSSSSSWIFIYKKTELFKIAA